MNRLILCISMIFTIQVSAQKLYFVYVQTEAEQPFFVKINERIHSSTSSGYLILSRLRDSTYKLNIGFPQDKFPEQHFSVTINRRDHGFILKNFGDKGWGLFNLNDLSVQMATVAASTGNIKEKPAADVSAFTDILSKAADDPSLRDKPLPPVTEEKKPAPQPVQVVIEENQKPAVLEPAVTKEVEPKTVVPDPIDKVVITSEYKPGTIIRQSESSTTAGLGILFIDVAEDGSRDSIQILIPEPKTMIAVKEEPKKEEKKFIEIIPEKKEEAKEVIEKPETKFTSDNLPVKMHVNNCKGVATESDFLKLRKKMAAETDDDDMVDEARKYFKSTCFTTTQIKNLSMLFLDDLGKYKFFDAAYIFVSDAENFQVLQSELKNEYYINRFRAMLK